MVRLDCRRVRRSAAVSRETLCVDIPLRISACSCARVPLFRKRDTSSKELVVLCVMIALSAAGRFIFAWLPGFKPVTAITVITAMWLGRDAGFAVGALSAAVSNFYFGQGPWTPFQMLAWGLIGFSAGVLAGPMRKSPRRAVRFRRGGGGDVFAAYGHLDGAGGQTVRSTSRVTPPRSYRRCR